MRSNFGPENDDMEASKDFGKVKTSLLAITTRSSLRLIWRVNQEIVITC